MPKAKKRPHPTIFDRGAVLPVVFYLSENQLVVLILNLSLFQKPSYTQDLSLIHI